MQRLPADVDPAENTPPPDQLADGTETAATESMPAEPASSPRAPSGARARATATAEVATPEDAMRHREIVGTNRFVGIGGALCLAVAAALPIIEADPVARWVLVVGLGVGLVGFARAAWVLRRPERYDTSDAALLAVTSFSAAISGIYYFGLFSPAPLVSTMGIFFFSLSRDDRVALLLFLGASIAHALLMGLIIAGVIADRGVIGSGGVATSHLVVVAVLVEVVFLMTYLIARANHAAMLDAAERLRASASAVAAREALLDEARRELDQALRVGGPGRFTEQQLGAWRLGLLCGRGAMADVYEAAHVDTGEPAAVKLLHREVLANPKHVHRFLREARIAASLEVPNVVRVLDVSSEDAPVPYLAMELLRGSDLATMLRERRRLSPREVVEMLRQVGRGVDAAHRAGIVHRDLKPQNLFRTEGEPPLWKVLDFGVSRLAGSTASLTAGQAVGTPSYMAPEQARGKSVDARADVFALGLVAYRALTGRPAFTASEIPELLYKIVHHPPPPASSVAPLPPAVDGVFAVALAKAPAKRYASVADLAGALERALSPIPV